MTDPISRLITVRLTDGTTMTRAVQQAPGQAEMMDSAAADPGSAITKWWYGNVDDEPKEVNNDV